MLALTATVAGCGVLTAPQPVTTISPPPPLLSGEPVAVAEHDPETGSVGEARPAPEPPAATARYRPTGAGAESGAVTGAAVDAVPDPERVATPEPSAPTGPDASASPSPTPTAAPLPGLLLAAGTLPTLSWSDAGGAHTAAWQQVGPAAAVTPADALPHVAAARAVGGECASAADAVVANAVDAATIALSADPAPGPIALALVRYPAAAAAADALAALQRMDAACQGAVTPDGTFGARAPALSASAALTDGDEALVLDATAHGTVLVAVVHPGAPIEAVTALASAQAAALG